MPESPILRQAREDATRFAKLSLHQRTNLLREVHYLLYYKAMYSFTSNPIEYSETEVLCDRAISSEKTTSAS